MLRNIISDIHILSCDIHVIVEKSLTTLAGFISDMCYLFNLWCAAIIRKVVSAGYPGYQYLLINSYNINSPV